MPNENYFKGKFMRLLFVFFLLVSLVFGENLKMIAPKNSADILEKIIKKFHTVHPNIKIILTPSNTYDIALKIKNGTLVDLAIGDDGDSFRELLKEGFLEGEKISFAKDNLVVFSFKKALVDKNLKELKKDSIKNITLLNPFENVEGKLAIKSLKDKNLYKKVKKKFVYANSLKKLLSYALHVSDVGIGTKSALLLPSFQKYKNQLEFFPLKKEKTLVAIQVKRYKPNKNAQIFLQFLKSKETQKILTKNGYTF